MRFPVPTKAKKVHNYIKSVAIARGRIICFNIAEPGVNEI